MIEAPQSQDAWPVAAEAPPPAPSKTSMMIAAYRAARLSQRLTQRPDPLPAPVDAEVTEASPIVAMAADAGSAADDGPVGGISPDSGAAVLVSYETDLPGLHTLEAVGVVACEPVAFDVPAVETGPSVDEGGASLDGDGAVEPGDEDGSVEPRDGHGSVEPRDEVGSVEPSDEVGSVELGSEGLFDCGLGAVGGGMDEAVGPSWPGSTEPSPPSGCAIQDAAVESMMDVPGQAEIRLTTVLPEPALAAIGLGPCMLIRLHQIGLRRVNDVAQANADDIRAALGDSSRLLNVEGWIASARNLNASAYAAE